MSSENENENQNVVFLKSVRNEKKRTQEPTRPPVGKGKRPSVSKTEEGFQKLLEVIEEQQARIQNLEKNFVALVRIIKKFTDQSAAPVPQSPPQDDA